MPIKAFLLFLLTFTSSRATEGPTSADDVSAENGTSVIEFIQNTWSTVCPYQPMCNAPSKWPLLPGTRSGCCNACSCFEHCHLLNNCCPDVLDVRKSPGAGTSLTAGDLNLSSDLFVCTPTVMRRQTRTYHQEYTMVSECPSTAPASLTEACKRGQLDDGLAPITHLVKGVIFKNTFCATCHGVRPEETATWTLNIRVLFPALVSGPSTGLLPNTVDEILKWEYTEVRAVPLGDAAVATSDECSTNILRMSCNTSGTWEKFDHKVEAACLFLDIPFGIDEFRNAYCRVCNPYRNNYRLEDVCDIPPKKKDIGDERSFIAIIEPNYLMSTPNQNIPVAYEEVELCPYGHKEDKYTGICRPVFCAPGKTFVHGSCRHMYTNIRYFRFLLALKMESHDIEYLKGGNERLIQTVRDCFQLLVAGRADVEVNLHFVLRTNDSLSDNRYLLGIAAINAVGIVHINILDWFQRRMALGFNAKGHNSKTISFTLSVHTRFHSTSVTFTKILLGTKPTFTDLESNMTLDAIFFEHLPFTVYNTIGVFYTALLFCEQFAFNNSEYIFQDNTAFFPAPNITLYPFEYLSLHDDNGGLRACINAYQGDSDDSLSFEDPEVLSPFPSRGVIIGIVISASAFVFLASVTAVIFYRKRKRLQNLNM